MSAVDAQVLKYLRWIEDNDISGAEWRRDGKAAYGHHDKWNEHRLSSRDSSITVSDITHRAAMPFVKIGPVGGTMFVLNEAGEALLREAALAKAEGRA